MSVKLYFFTGTGNSLFITKEISRYFPECEEIAMARIWEQENLKTSSDIVGLIFPLYYWGIPLIVKEFVQKMNFNKTSYIFAVVNAGGDIPGIAFMQLNDILKEKSKRLNASFFTSMPSNYLLAGDQAPEEEQKEKLLNVKDFLSKIGNQIANKEETPLITTHEKMAKTNQRMNSRFHSKVKESDNLFSVDDNCTGCGVCETVCSMHNIILKNSKPEWLHNCQQCLACLNYCPENAIQYGRSTVGKRRYHHPQINPEDLLMFY